MKNTFNCVPWNVIMESLVSKGVPGYICRLLEDYFSGRELLYDVSGIQKRRKVTAGVSQGFVLGPTLWNFLYDGLLRLLTPEGMEIIAYADNIAIVACAPVIFKVGKLLEETVEMVVDWLALMDIELVIEKSELLIPTKKRKHNTLEITIKGRVIAS